MFDHEIINFAEKSKRQQFSDVFAFFSVSEDGLNEWIFLNPDTRGSVGKVAAQLRKKERDESKKEKRSRLK